nr:glycosyltransferase family 2 protein [Exiguobacterium sp. s80]
MPAYNAEENIGESIQSVMNQTFKNWELIIVDDCSKDSTQSIIKETCIQDSRVKYHKLTQNSGAAVARNLAIEKAKGEYIAFLDSDDLWFPNKLETQINFMTCRNYIFTCTFYNKIDEKGNDMKRIVTSNSSMNYNDLLHNCPGNSTVIYNANKLGEKFLIPSIKKRNDYLMWLKVIKKAESIFCLDLVMGSHRIRRESLSKNKFSLVKYHWIIYRKIEKLNPIYSLYLIFYWIFKSIIKK